MFTFEDGDVIIKTTTTMFRVHSTVLSRKSRVFRTILSSRKPERWRGLPVVRLGAFSGGVANLLSFLYDSHA